MQLINPKIKKTQTNLKLYPTHSLSWQRRSWASHRCMPTEGLQRGKSIFRKRLGLTTASKSFYFWFLICLFFFVTLFPNEFHNACTYQIKTSSTFQQYTRPFSCHHEWLPCSLQFSSKMWGFLIGHCLWQDTALWRCMVIFSGTVFTLCSYNKCTELVYKDLLQVSKAAFHKLCVPNK